MILGFLVLASASCGVYGTALAQLVANGPLAITTSALSSGINGFPYEGSIEATGGTSTRTWSIASGALPAGLTLEASTGKIVGTPTTNGRFHFRVTVVDHGDPAQSASKALSMTNVARLLHYTSRLPWAIDGTPYAAKIWMNGGVWPYTYAITSGSLPAGLTLTADTGVISGTPTGTGTSTFTVTVKDHTYPIQVAIRTFSITATTPVAIQTPSVTSGKQGTAYVARMTANGGKPGYYWSITSGSLPAGVALATTGVLSGTPAVSGTFQFTASVTDHSVPYQSQTAAMSLVIAAPAPVEPQVGNTWYVRPDGGTRYSANMTSGQCDGTMDVSYASTGGTDVNQHCAFKDVRYLWQDGSYTVDATQAAFPSYGWIGSGGDTYIIRGSLGTGVSYRVGWNNPYSSYDPATGQFWGVQGNTYASGAPAPLSGTASQHTRILGENYASCSSVADRTQLHGGYAVTDVLYMSGSSYVDVSCIDITDFSNCGKSSQQSSCYAGGVTQDYAANGIQFSNTSTNDTLTNVRIHGMALAGLIGPTGNGVVMNHLDILGNANAGWNADAGDGQTGSGSLLVQHFNISWNGCAEEYPIVDAVPYGDCTDQDSGGYGDGFGTSTVQSSPAWTAHFDQGTVAYNTQDGLDALHLTGAGSSMTITRTLAYGNMGQQIKVGGAGGSASNNLIVGNCYAMSEAIPGTPSGFNAHLGLFCRASNTAVLLSTGKNTLTTFDNNTIITAGTIAVGIVCDQTAGACDHSSLVDFRNNIFVGYPDIPANGDPNGAGANPASIYQCVGDGDCGAASSLNFNVFGNAGSFYSNNVTTGQKSSMACPASYESAAICGSPGLVDESFHLYGYGNMSPLASSSVVVGSGTPLPSDPIDYYGATRRKPPTMGAVETNVP